MNKQRHNDVYDHPRENEIKQQERLNNKTGSKAELKVTPNPNPRANENIIDRETTDEDEIASQAGSEITDGEDG